MHSLLAERMLTVDKCNYPRQPPVFFFLGKLRSATSQCWLGRDSNVPCPAANGKPPLMPTYFVHMCVFFLLLHNLVAGLAKQSVWQRDLSYSYLPAAGKHSTVQADATLPETLHGGKDRNKVEQILVDTACLKRFSRSLRRV